MNRFQKQADGWRSVEGRFVANSDSVASASPRRWTRSWLLAVIGVLFLVACAALAYVGYEQQQRLLVLQQRLTETERERLRSHELWLAKLGPVQQRLDTVEAQLRTAASDPASIQALHDTLARERAWSTVFELEQRLLSVQQQLPQRGSAAAYEDLVGVARRVQALEGAQFSVLKQSLEADLTALKGLNSSALPQWLAALEDLSASVESLPGWDQAVTPAPQKPATAATPTLKPPSAPKQPTNSLSNPNQQQAQVPLIGGARHEDRREDGLEPSPAGAGLDALPWWRRLWDHLAQRFDRWVEIRRVDGHDAILLSPQQVEFVRENMRLRFLTARMAVLAQDFELARHELTAAQAALKYFDADAAPTAALRSKLSDVMTALEGQGLPASDAAANLSTSLKPGATTASKPLMETLRVVRAVRASLEAQP